MTNRFYNESFNAALGSLGRSSAVDNQFQSIEAGFDALQAELDGVQSRGTSFTNLEGAPASFEGAALKYLRVNAAASSIEFVSGGKLGLKSFGGTARDALPSDAGHMVMSTSSDPVTVTLLTEATQTSTYGAVMEAGDVIVFNQLGTGQITFAPESGSVNVYSSDGLLSTRTQYAQVALVYLGSDDYMLVGERNAPTLGFAAITGGNAFTGAQTVEFAALTDDTTINWDASVSNHFGVTLGGNRTLANPTNARDGGIYNFWIKQDGSGSKTLAYGNKFKWPSGTAPTLTTTAGALDLIIAQYNASLDILACSITKDIR